MKKLIIISAPSGAGKTTICNRILNEFPDVKLSVSYTSRDPRGKEKNGRDYSFISKNEFEKMIKNNEFAEYAVVHDNYYGTSKKFIEKTIENLHILLDIDVQGARNLKKLFPKNSFLIFISPPSMGILEKRLRDRGTDSENTIIRRLSIAKKEMDQSDFFDLVIVNDELEKAYNEIKTKLILELKK